MIYNNLKTIVIFIPTIIVIVLVSFMSELDIKFSVLGFAINLMLGIGYIVYGYFFMNDCGSKIKNFISVIFIAIFGIVLWIVCFNNTDYRYMTGYNLIGDGFVWKAWEKHDETWKYYDTYMAPFSLITFPIQFFLDIITDKIGFFVRDIAILYLCFIPSILLWVGIMLKKRNSHKNIEIDKGKY